MDKEAQEKIVLRPHYCTHYFRVGNNKFRGRYLYWGRCWCGFEASAYGQQLAECKMHGHAETMQLGYHKLPEGKPPLLSDDSEILEALERTYKFTWRQLICDYIKDDLVSPSEVEQFLIALVEGNKKAQRGNDIKWYG